MAFLVVPVAGGALGGLAGVALSWSYTQAANFSASKLYGKTSLATRHDIQTLHSFVRHLLMWGAALQGSRRHIPGLSTSLYSTAGPRPTTPAQEI